MSGGLQITFATLSSTKNEAAVAVLLSALDAGPRTLRDAALEAILSRRSDLAEREILSRWNQLSERWKTQIAERMGWISGAVRQAVLGNDEQLYQAGCEAALWTRDYDQIPVLVGAAQDQANPCAQRAAAAVLHLAEMLCEEVAAPRDYRIRRDPQLQRQHVMPSLERAAFDYESHQRRELLEAFLLLADRENAVLKRILQSPADRTFLPMLDLLATSSRQGVMRLLLSYLDDCHAPLAAIHVIARRRDVSFLRNLLRKIGGEPTPVVRANLRRIESIPWLQEQVALLDALSETEQPGAVQLAVLSGVNRQRAQDAVAYILRHGKVSGRRAAARGLAEFRGAEANNLAMRALEDEDPQVRALVAAQLRERGVPGAINKLIALLDSPHQAEREAAQASLDEFRLERFLVNFDNLPEDVRRSTGKLVKRVDPQAAGIIRAELQAPTRSRRKRGLELVQSLDLALELQEALAVLMRDEDQFLRIEAVRILGECDNARTRQLMREAMLDPHPMVQEAAESALVQLTRGSAEPRSGGVKPSSGDGAAASGEAAAKVSDTRHVKAADTVPWFPVAPDDSSRAEEAAPEEALL